jgi:hypothetical protein
MSYKIGVLNVQRCKKGLTKEILLKNLYELHPTLQESTFELIKKYIKIWPVINNIIRGVDSTFDLCISGFGEIISKMKVLESRDITPTFKNVFDKEDMVKKFMDHYILLNEYQIYCKILLYIIGMIPRDSAIFYTTSQARNKGNVVDMKKGITTEHDIFDDSVIKSIIDTIN